MVELKNEPKPAEGRLLQFRRPPEKSKKNGIEEETKGEYSHPPAKCAEILIKEGRIRPGDRIYLRANYIKGHIDSQGDFVLNHYRETKQGERDEWLSDAVYPRFTLLGLIRDEIAALKKARVLSERDPVAVFDESGKRLRYTLADFSRS